MTARLMPALAPALLLGLLLPPALAAEYRQDIGFRALEERLGAALPTGAGITAVQVEVATEVDGRQTWMADPGHREFIGKRVANLSEAPAGVWSGHATSVGRHVYGRRSSIAPGIASVAVFGAEHWIGAGFLRTPLEGPGPQPLALRARIANHSWVGDAPAPLAAGILRRMDWVTERDQLVQLTGLTNGARNRQLMANAFNIIAVGRSDGSHGTGSVALDEIYTAGRVRPHIVVPARNTSRATAQASAAAALLIETALRNPALSAAAPDRQALTRAGARLPDAARSVVIKAILMAGARRATANISGADLEGWRAAPEHRSGNGLDLRYGAGQLDILHSYLILSAGQQHSAEENAGDGGIGEFGFDFAPRFGGAAGSPRTGTYRLPVSEARSMLAAALVWDLRIAGGEPASFDGTATLYDLDLLLLDLSDPAAPQTVHRSAGRGDNSENLWVALEPGRRYALQVRPAPGQPDFDWPYALAWRSAPCRADAPAPQAAAGGTDASC